jgi:hypothetical protein
LGALGPESREVCLKDRVENARVFDAGGADDFAELEAAQGGGDDVACPS